VPLTRNGCRARWGVGFVGDRVGLRSARGLPGAVDRAVDEGFSRHGTMLAASRASPNGRPAARAERPSTVVGVQVKPTWGRS